jgi:hypothetical protein
MLLPLARDGAGGKGEVWGWGGAVSLEGRECTGERGRELEKNHYSI